MLLNRPVRTAAGLGIAAISGLAYAYWEAGAFRVVQSAVEFGLGGTRIRLLHISDLHLVPGSRLVDWLPTLAELEPDLVVGTGDFLAHPDAVPALVSALGKTMERPGAFVLGSNDYYAPVLRSPTRYLQRDDGQRHHGPELPWRELRAALAAEGWADLTNCRTQLEVSGITIDLVGVDDPHIGRDRYPEATGEPPSTLRLGVAHAPYRRVLEAMSSDGVDLALCGHTHGGQLCAPGVGALVTNCDLPRGLARGLSWHAAATGPAPYGGRHGRGMALHVSEGLGTNPFTPVRFACRPTATLLTLH